MLLLAMRIVLMGGRLRRWAAWSQRNDSALYEFDMSVLAGRIEGFLITPFLYDELYPSVEHDLIVKWMVASPATDPLSPSAVWQGELRLSLSNRQNGVSVDRSSTEVDVVAQNLDVPLKTLPSVPSWCLLPPLTICLSVPFCFPVELGQRFYIYATVYPPADIYLEPQVYLTTDTPIAVVDRAEIRYGDKLKVCGAGVRRLSLADKVAVSDRPRKRYRELGRDDIIAEDLVAVGRGVPSFIDGREKISATARHPEVRETLPASEEVIYGARYGVEFSWGQDITPAFVTVEIEEWLIRLLVNAAPDLWVDVEGVGGSSYNYSIYLPALIALMDRGMPFKVRGEEASFLTGYPLSQIEAEFVPQATVAGGRLILTIKPNLLRGGIVRRVTLTYVPPLPPY